VREQLQESLNILLEGVPEGIELADINDALLKLKGVTDVHDLHVWALTNGKISLTAHLVVNEEAKDDNKILETASILLEEKYAITHSTIQIETAKCAAKEVLYH
jgi:cobalt-zinc-cadmium efflux system protein